MCLSCPGKMERMQNYLFLLSVRKKPGSNLEFFYILDFLGLLIYSLAGKSSSFKTAQWQIPHLNHSFTTSEMIPVCQGLNIFLFSWKRWRLSGWGWISAQHSWMDVPFPKSVYFRAEITVLSALECPVKVFVIWGSFISLHSIPA